VGPFLPSVYHATSEMEVGWLHRSGLSAPLVGAAFLVSRSEWVAYRTQSLMMGFCLVCHSSPVGAESLNGVVCRPTEGLPLSPFRVTVVWQGGHDDAL
jgi:hypothetical protein